MEEFFALLVRHGLGKVQGTDETLRDFDLYLMETRILPLLLQGLDALSRHIDKMMITAKESDPSRARFNPLVWLAQYLLRNHPLHVTDQRAPMYAGLAEKANIERGRRAILRRKPQITEAWSEYQRKENSAGSSCTLAKDELHDFPPTEKLNIAQVPEFIEYLDSLWGLRGSFATKMPSDYTQLIHPKHERDEVRLDEFWAFFEAHVLENDLMREHVLERAEQDGLRPQSQDEPGSESSRDGDGQMWGAHLLDRFQMTLTDMNVNEVLIAIATSRAVLREAEPVRVEQQQQQQQQSERPVSQKSEVPEQQEQQEQETGAAAAPVKGAHVGLICQLLSLWGKHVPEGSREVWSQPATCQWNAWLRTHDIQGRNNVVNASGLKSLKDFQAFSVYVQRVCQRGQCCVELLELFEDELETYVMVHPELFDERRRITLPSNMVATVRERLAFGPHPVLGEADTGTWCLIELHVGMYGSFEETLGLIPARTDGNDESASALAGEDAGP
eukprot:NODE_4326_length_1905_cov_5.174916.p1 GENE.NODE_4326_length_1905_cov_5.174916~~NODE_4326_length_1905_cov_5.174916.p1  ORF type:complete len:502 (-),score=134.40 NODE_4326_length_1905_cov_5.174916:226-1731(-)